VVLLAKCACSPRQASKSVLKLVGDSRRPGEGRYAQLEREQRWLLEELPPGITDEASNRRPLLDGHVTAASNDSESQRVVYKLCQKVRLDEDNPELVKITKHLSQRE